MGNTALSLLGLLRNTHTHTRINGRCVGSNFPLENLWLWLSHAHTQCNDDKGTDEAGYLRTKD